jgi:hypothetical protein
VAVAATRLGWPPREALVDGLDEAKATPIRMFARKTRSLMLVKKCYPSIGRQKTRNWRECLGSVAESLGCWNQKRDPLRRRAHSQRLRLDVSEVQGTPGHTALLGPVHRSLDAERYFAANSLRHLKGGASLPRTQVVVEYIHFARTDVRIASKRSVWRPARLRIST